MANGSNANVTLAKIRSGSAYFQQDGTTKNNEIRAVQKALSVLGYYTHGTDGIYGNGTTAAVRGFQKENNLSVDGSCGKATLAKLESYTGTLYGSPTNTPTFLAVRLGLDYFHLNDTGSAITGIRVMLNNLGYSCTTSTSVYDNDLMSVVKNFQTAHGLTADGYVGQATLAILENPSTNWFASNKASLNAGIMARLGFSSILLRPEIVSSINNACNTYGINTKEKVKHFLAQIMHETGKGLYLTETLYYPGSTGSKEYSPYYGGGMIQLTWEDAYNQYATYKGDSRILTPDTYATQHVAVAYPADSAGWFWNNYKKLNDEKEINWSGTAQSISYALTKKISGGTGTQAARYDNYVKISTILT